MRIRPLLLIVEDNAPLRNLYRIAAGAANFDVHACEDGIRALQYLDQEQPDLVILDLDLPGVPGTDIYHELRAHEVTRDVPIIICTGVDPVPDLPRATVLRKPCGPEQLLAAVDRALQPMQTAWLFVRGQRAVRLSRRQNADRSVELCVGGPGNLSREFAPATLLECARRQFLIERELAGDGYEKLPLFFGNRRTAVDRRAGNRLSPLDRRKADGAEFTVA
jgi:DNA-binding response OmpR family regulator